MRRKILIAGISLLLPMTLFVVVLTLVTCKHESQIGSLDTVCFDSLVLPIFQTSCGISGCHDGTGEDAGYYLRTYQGIMAGITPYKPENSTIYKAIVSPWVGNAMPPNQPLSENNRTIIRVWIEQGATETHCFADTTDTSPVVSKQRACFERDILPIFQGSCAMSTDNCHDAAQHSHGVVLISYATVMSNGISPGDPNNSELYLITTAGSEDRMPPSPYPVLTSIQRDSIRNWILYGALDETCIYSDCDTTSVSYTNDVDPILQYYCISCHNDVNQNGSVNLSNYNGVSIVAANGKLVGSIKRLNGYFAMPPSAALNGCSVDIISAWVNAGALDN